MVKITYDLNNKEEVALVEDYFFYEYYVETIKFDWKHLCIHQCENYEEQNEKLNIVKNHLNKYELKRAIRIHKNVYSDGMGSKINWEYFFLSDCFSDIKYAKILKQNMIRQFGNK